MERRRQPMSPLRLASSRKMNFSPNCSCSTMQKFSPITSSEVPIRGVRQKGGQNEIESGIRCCSVQLLLRYKRLQLNVITQYYAVTRKRAIRQNLFSHLHLPLRPTPLSTDSSHTLFIASILHNIEKNRHVTKIKSTSKNRRNLFEFNAALATTALVTFTDRRLEASCSRNEGDGRLKPPFLI
jgi:hypothetical protein